MGVLGLAQGFAGLGFNFLPAEPNTTLAMWLFAGAAVCIAAGVLLFVWPRKAEEPTATATQSGSRNVQIQGQTVTFQGTISTGEGEVPAVRLPGGRTLVDVTPEYLTGLFDEHTDIQAEKLVEAFVGKWVRVSGAVRNVKASGEDGATVYLSRETAGASVSMEFNDRSAVEVLKKGGLVTAIGQIERVDSLWVGLGNCELERP